MGQPSVTKVSGKKRRSPKHSRGKDRAIILTTLALAVACLQGWVKHASAEENPGRMDASPPKSNRNRFGRPSRTVQSQRVPKDPRFVGFLKKYWIWPLLLVILAWLYFAGDLDSKYLSTDGSGCLREAMSAVKGPLATCESNLEKAVANGIGGTSSGNALFKGGMPRVLIWVDNLFVDLYTLFFIGASCAAYKWLTTVARDLIFLWRIGIGVTCSLAVLGGIADHAENFWLLAHMDPSPITNPGVSSEELAWVAQISGWKFRLFLINSGITALWWLSASARMGWARYRYKKLQDIIDAAMEVAKVPERPNVDSSTLLDETSFRTLLIVDADRQVYLAVLIHYFFVGLKTESRLTYSFSRHAVDRWFKHVRPRSRDNQTEQELRDDEQELQDDISWLLDMLSINRFLSLKGSRYHVTLSDVIGGVGEPRFRFSVCPMRGAEEPLPDEVAQH